MSTAAKLAYKPVGIVGGMVGGLIAGAIFKQVWKRVAGEDDPPGPRQSEYDWKQLLIASALQGAIYAAVKATVDRAGAKGFQLVTGTWPGD